MPTRLAKCIVLVGLGLLACVSGPGCEVGGEQIDLPPLAARRDDAGRQVFTCVDETTVGCEVNVHYTCERRGEFLLSEAQDCNEGGMTCDPQRGCVVCRPDTVRCEPCAPGEQGCDVQQIQRCDSDGEQWLDEEVCDLRAAKTCSSGSCVDMCDLADQNKSYVGCEFHPVDLDNAAIDDRNNAAAQQFAVVVTNPHEVPIDVKVELNDAPFGQPIERRVLEEIVVPPGALEVLELPQREVDGSSSNGLNDGTHTAVSSRAFVVTSSHPIIAYQFNPLENVDVFSNDASLLLPRSAIGTDYTVVGWPQTIGDSDNPDEDFDATSSNEDLRAFLTVVGTTPDTDVEIEFGRHVRKVVGAGPIPQSGPGDRLELQIGPFDVINLETEGFNADFTGTRIRATQPVTVFVGSEASDVPMFGTYATRRCCADHLEEQLFPDSALGFNFAIARMPSRTQALQAAGAEGEALDVAVINEPEWVRVVAVNPGVTRIRTTLPFPDDEFELMELQDATLRADQDFLLDADKQIAVLQALPSQGVTGIPRQYPGGDPAIIMVPPLQQYRRDYIFLTPDKYAFDFITIMADAQATILLDGAPLPDHCTTAPADGLPRGVTAPEPDQVVHRCQLSFPEVTAGTGSQTTDGIQDDGAHTLVSDAPVGIIVSGFDRFVSYAYAGGLNLDRID